MTIETGPDDEPETLPEEIVHWQPTHRPPVRVGASPGVAAGGAVSMLAAVGALALGALAIGALSVGAMAIGRLAVGRARFRELEIDRLIIHRIVTPRR